LIKSTEGIAVQGWGLPGDRIIPGDYDADGKTDISVFRPSNNTWYRILSSNSTVNTVQWGLAGDVAVPADYDGDEADDVAVWRPSNGIWYIQESGNGHFNFSQPWDFQ
jgi:hypothetical protein